MLGDGPLRAVGAHIARAVNDRAPGTDEIAHCHVHLDRVCSAADMDLKALEFVARGGEPHRMPGARLRSGRNFGERTGRPHLGSGRFAHRTVLELPSRLASGTDRSPAPLVYTAPASNRFKEFWRE
jgi:hypothetical protein